MANNLEIAVIVESKYTRSIAERGEIYQ